MSNGLALSTIGALLQHPNAGSTERTRCNRRLLRSETELAVGAQSYEVEMVGIRLAIDQD